MAWINIVEKKDAAGDLKEIYDDISKKRGKLSNIMKIQSLNPKAMKNHMDLYLSIMFDKSGLNRKQRELIGVVVSEINKCEYCINHHVEALNFYWKDIERITKLLNNYKTANLSKKEEIMLDYASKLTIKPHSTRKEDINNLRKAGFNDKDILNINLITSYFNFVNRIALGLGIEFSRKEVQGYKY